MIKNIYCVTMQVFGKEGTVLTNEYQRLITPFHPEESKLMYMREHPGVVLERDNIKVLSHFIIENEVRHQKIMNLKKEIEFKKGCVRTDAGKGKFGQGDEAVEKVKKTMRDILEEELTLGMEGGSVTPITVPEDES